MARWLRVAGIGAAWVVGLALLVLVLRTLDTVMPFILNGQFRLSMLAIACCGGIIPVALFGMATGLIRSR